VRQHRPQALVRKQTTDAAAPGRRQPEQVGHARPSRREQWCRHHGQEAVLEHVRRETQPAQGVQGQGEHDGEDRKTDAERERLGPAHAAPRTGAAPGTMQPAAIEAAGEQKRHRDRYLPAGPRRRLHSTPVRQGPPHWGHCQQSA
jgi:hypothetical protein